jgi:hypothetical protein
MLLCRERKEPQIGRRLVGAQTRGHAPGVPAIVRALNVAVAPGRAWERPLRCPHRDGRGRRHRHRHASRDDDGGRSPGFVTLTVGKSTEKKAIVHENRSHNGSIPRPPLRPLRIRCHHRGRRWLADDSKRTGPLLCMGSRLRHRSTTCRRVLAKADWWQVRAQHCHRFACHSDHCCSRNRDRVHSCHFRRCHNSQRLWFAPNDYQIPLNGLDEIIEGHEDVDQRVFSRRDTFWKFRYRDHDLHRLHLSDLLDANRGPIIEYLRRHGVRFFKS